MFLSDVALHVVLLHGNLIDANMQATVLLAYFLPHSNKDEFFEEIN